MNDIDQFVKMKCASRRQADQVHPHMTILDGRTAKEVLCPRLNWSEPSLIHG